MLLITKEGLRAMISLRATLPSELRSHDYTKDRELNNLQFLLLFWDGRESPSKKGGLSRPPHKLV